MATWNMDRAASKALLVRDPLVSRKDIAVAVTY